MSEIADNARVSILIGDFAATDAAGKVNVLGAGWQFAGIDAQTGMSAPHTLLVMVDIPPAHYNDSFALAAYLVDETDTPVEVPGPAGDPQALRIQHLAKVEEPNLPGVVIRRKIVPAHIQMVVDFRGGLPLPPSHMYSWQVEIDGDARPTWRSSFYVVGPPPAPVIG